MNDSRKARVEIDASSTKLDRGLKEAQASMRRFGREQEREARRAAKVAEKEAKARDRAHSEFFKGAKRRVGEKVTESALGFVTSTVEDLAGFERTLARYQIATGKSSAEMGRFRAEILATASATGVAHGEILSGTQAYVDLTGDVDGARAAMMTFARVAQASGSSVSDIATASATLRQAGIPAEQLEATFSGMIMQGKAGAVTLRDFANELTKIAPRWAKFNEGTTVTGIAQMGAAFQVARQGFKGSSEAATGLEALMGSLEMNADKFAKAGVKIFDTHKSGGKTVKTFRAFDQIISSIEKSKLVRDPQALAKAFGSKEAAQAFDMIHRARTEMNANGGTLWGDLVKAGQDVKAVGRDFETYLNSPAGRLERTFAALKVCIAEAFTPERIDAFAKKIESLGDKLGPIIGFVGKYGGGALGAFQEAGESAHELIFGDPDMPSIMEMATDPNARRRGEAVKAYKKAFMDIHLDSDAGLGVERSGSGALGRAILHSQATGEGAVGRRGAAEEFFKQTGFVTPSQFNAQVIAELRKMTALLADGKPIVVKTDSNVAAKTVANAPVNRQPRHR
jgi:hypothetical protein